MNGKAPNWFVTGFHSPLTRKPRPKVRKLGAALTVSTIAMSPRSARTATPAAPEPARKRVSPQDDPVGWSRARRAPRRNGKAMGASTRERGRPLKVLAIERDHVDRRSVLRGNGAYVSDVAVVCPVLIAHLRNATRAWAFSWVIPFGYTSNS